MSRVETSAGKMSRRVSRAAPGVPAVSATSSEGIEDFFRIVFEPSRGSVSFFQLVSDNLRLVETVKRGIPVRAVDTLIAHKVLTRSEIDSLVMPRRTLAHRERKGEALNEAESERVLRIARIVAIAEDTFANSEKAAVWLRRPSRLFGGKTPLAMADTEPGGRIVEDALRRIAHGIAA